MSTRWPSCSASTSDDDNWSAFDWQHAADRMAEYGFKEAIVTLGGDGSVVLDTAAPEGQWIVRIAPVKVDAVGTPGAATPLWEQCSPAGIGLQPAGRGKARVIRVGLRRHRLRCPG